MADPADRDYAAAAERLHAAVGQGDWPAAAAAWDRLQHCDGLAPRQFVDAGLALRRLQRFAAADAVLARGRAAYPDFPELLIDHGWVALEAQDLATALPRWQEVVARLPDQPTGPQGLAICLVRAGRLAEAEAVLQAALARFPAHLPLGIEWVELARAQHDWPTAIQRATALRAHHPDNPHVARQLVMILREHGSLDDAEQVIHATLAHTPATADLRVEQALIAEARGDWATAAARWEAVAAAAPHEPRGYARGAATLRAAGRADAAEALLQAGVERLPHAAELRAAWAHAARGRGDLHAALQRWRDHLAIHPESAEAAVGAAYAARELGDADLAEALLAPALARWPDDVHVLAEHAWTGDRLRARDGARVDALQRWLTLAGRCPDQPLGHVRAAECHRDAGRLDVAEAMLQRAVERFPHDLSAAAAYARIAVDRGDAPAARARWEAARARFGQDTLPHLGLVHALEDAGDWDAAEAAADLAVRRFPAHRELRQEHARLASLRADHARALQRWAALVADFPPDVAICCGHATALRAAGRLDDAAACIAAGLQHAPNNFDLDCQRALTLSAMRDWPAALPLLETLLRRDPDSALVQRALQDALWQSRLDQGAAALAATAQGGEVIGGLRAAAAPAQHADAGLRDLLMRFDSLGDTCEFGILQRHFGAEPLGLLRWATVLPADLLAAMRERFQGVGRPEQTELGVTDDHYWLKDTRYNFYFATFTSAQQETAAAFYPQQCLRVQYLARALRETLAAAETILVYKYDTGFDDDYLLALHQAMRTYHPDATLLGVRRQAPGAPGGTLRVLREKLFCGYVGHFSNTDLAVDDWLALCRQAAGLRGPSVG